VRFVRQKSTSRAAAQEDNQRMLLLVPVLQARLQLSADLQLLTVKLKPVPERRALNCRPSYGGMGKKIRNWYFALLAGLLRLQPE
jgi:hypothetical protein